MRRAQILLPADADGPHGSAERIAAADVCRTSTGERLRQRCVEPGGDAALNRVERQQPPVATLLTGDQEARSSATRLGPPPQGDNNGTLRWLARQVVALDSVAAVRDETVRRTRKTTACRIGRAPTGSFHRQRTPRSLPTGKRGWQATKSRTSRPCPSSAWTNRLGSYCKRRARPWLPRPNPARGLTTKTNARARPPSACAPHRWPAGGQAPFAHEKRSAMAGGPLCGLRQGALGVRHPQHPHQGRVL